MKKEGKEVEKEGRKNGNGGKRMEMEGKGEKKG